MSRPRKLVPNGSWHSVHTRLDSEEHAALEFVSSSLGVSIIQFARQAIVEALRVSAVPNPLSTSPEVNQGPLRGHSTTPCPPPEPEGQGEAA